jgi:hypothetical protein
MADYRETTGINQKDSFETMQTGADTKDDITLTLDNVSITENDVTIDYTLENSTIAAANVELIVSLAEPAYGGGLFKSYSVWDGVQASSTKSSTDTESHSISAGTDVEVCVSLGNITFTP